MTRSIVALQRTKRRQLQEHVVACGRAKISINQTAEEISMLTPFGKELRKLRIDREMRLGEMAKLLEVSAAFLSAVETGKKSVPEAMVSEIGKALKLKSEQVARLKQAAAASVISVRIELREADTEARELAVGFARRFPDLTEQQKQALQKLLFDKAS
jgi:transcriptional regulator with XRE-family HTH domain